ncbi:MAG: efflux RND transporter periplasmic adaptor subunit [Candidatus Hydrogenedentes bacterium]|nr:efflux RND transporter periplasmic adaptor subunit [Candidatus Hydrogenedentota bacterium]
MVKIHRFRTVRGVLNGALASRLFACSCLAASLSALPACSNGAAPAAATSRPPVPVAVAQTTQKTVPIRVKVIGSVEPYNTVNVRSQVSGQLESVHFTEGQFVKKGDVLFTLDQRPFQAALRQAQAGLAKDQAQLANAKVETARAKKAADQGIDNLQNYEQRHTAESVLEAAIVADNAAIEKARLDLDYCTITAPMDGRTGNVMIHAGNLVKANDTPFLVSINQVQPIFVTFYAPEETLPAIKEHLAKGEMGVEAILPGAEDRPIKGSVTFLDNSIDSATGRIRLKGTFGNEDQRLWPGQYIKDVIMTLGVRENAIIVPTAAVQVGQQGHYVYVVKADKTVEARPVTVVDAVDGQSVVTQGLQPAETVVTDGHLRLSPGAAVRPKEAGAAGARDAAS